MKLKLLQFRKIEIYRIILILNGLTATINQLYLRITSIALLQTVHVPGTTKPLGPFSLGKIVSPLANLVYISGNIGCDTVEWNLVSDDVQG